MMGLPVDIARCPEEDQEEVEEGVSGDEGYLTGITEIEPIGDLYISFGMHMYRATYTDASDAVLPP